ncbi:lysozyme inhibitor LprI family protein [Aquibacillus kalidii]|uniref:lysozyme inhibitor LprI family protein n=1 Tax=Aquibacillus kalidii TaxID=2762597 RepID=UPI0016482719|nr:lysozyme inhibitor LprI family protein [Aquibacillus kalidii]
MSIKILCLYIAIFMLVGCGNTSDEPTTISSENDSVTKAIKEDIDSPKANEGTSQSEPEESVQQDSDDTASENSSTNAKDDNAEASLKNEYLKKLNDTNKETEDLKATDPSTYAEKKVANDRLEIWDGLLNEIYGVLEEQLPPEEMEQLREEQRNWIDYRDNSALEASLEYKGGTQEHLEYVIVLANLTKERCYELVEEYM